MPNYLRIIVVASVFLLPVLCNLVEHSASAILALLTLAGIFSWFTRKKTVEFTLFEKIILWSFALYFFTSVFFFLIHGIFRETATFHWNLDHELRFLAFIPIYFLFRQAGLRSWTIWYGAAIAAILCGLFSIKYLLDIHAFASESGPRSTMAFAELLRVSGAYTPITFGQLSLAFGGMSFCGIRYFQKTRPALIFIPVVALLSGVLASFLSGTRGSILVIPFLSVIFFIQLGTSSHPWRNRAAVILSLIILSAGLYFMPGSAMDQRFRAGFTQAKAFLNGEGTGKYVVRLAMWREAWEIFVDNPLLGTGKDGYNDIIEAKAAKNEVPKTIERFYSPHSNYLTNMAAYGITGLLILLAIFLTPFLIFIPALKAPWPKNDMAYTGITLVVSFMIFAITETIFYRNINISVYLILLAATLHLTQSDNQRSTELK